MLVHGCDQHGKEHQELQVVLRVGTRLQQVGAVSRNRPVVVLARSVDVLEGLLVLQAYEAMAAGDQAHLLHG